MTLIRRSRLSRQMGVTPPDKGGHFAAWEQPALFASELRAAFKQFR